MYFIGNKKYREVMMDYISGEKISLPSLTANNMDTFRRMCPVSIETRRALEKITSPHSLFANISSDDDEKFKVNVVFWDSAELQAKATIIAVLDMYKNIDKNIVKNFMSVSGLLLPYRNIMKKDYNRLIVLISKAMTFINRIENINILDYAIHVNRDVLNDCVKLLKKYITIEDTIKSFDKEDDLVEFIEVNQNTLQNIKYIEVCCKSMFDYNFGSTNVTYETSKLFVYGRLTTTLDTVYKEDYYTYIGKALKQFNKVTTRKGLIYEIFCASNLFGEGLPHEKSLLLESEIAKILIENNIVSYEDLKLYLPKED